MMLGISVGKPFMGNATGIRPEDMSAYLSSNHITVSEKYMMTEEDEGMQEELNRVLVKDIPALNANPWVDPEDVVFQYKLNHSIYIPSLKTLTDLAIWVPDDNYLELFEKHLKEYLLGTCKADEVNTHLGCGTFMDIYSLFDLKNSMQKLYTIYNSRLAFKQMPEDFMNRLKAETDGTVRRDLVDKFFQREHMKAMIEAEAR